MASRPKYSKKLAFATLPLAPPLRAAPLRTEQMEAMFAAVDRAVAEHGCDHTLRQLRQWAHDRGLDFDNIAEWCRGRGGYCDCEVLMNCEPQWRGV